MLHWGWIFLFLFLNSSEAALQKNQKTAAHELLAIQSQILNLEKELIENSKGSRRSRNKIKKLRVLLSLQRKERALGEEKLKKIEAFVSDLEKRRTILNKRIREHQAQIRKFLIKIDQSENRNRDDLINIHSEKTYAPRRKILSRLVDRGLKQIEILRVDLVDADELELRIQEEKEHLTYLLQEQKEKEELIRFRKNLQAEVFRERYTSQLKQLESFRKLKSTENQVKDLIQQFNARVEFNRLERQERKIAKAVIEGDFPKFKGQLDFPVSGKVVSRFGKHFDPNLRLNVFKKGIDISAGKNQPVRSIFEGKVAYSGVLPEYGKVTIMHHGRNHYSLVAKLGEGRKKVGDFVKKGEVIGLTDSSGTPIYFEIRNRNVAVNPLQWVSN